MLGGKCKGPKKPMEEHAAVAVEDAWWATDVEEQLDEQSEIRVDVALEADFELDSQGEAELAVVRFTRVVGDETQASVVIRGEQYVFEVSPDGDVSDW